MRILARISVAAVALVATVLVAPSPAKAYDLCGALLGSYVNENYVGLCIENYWTLVDEQDGVEMRTQVAIGKNATKATNCKVTMWAALDSPSASPWYTPQIPRSCDNALKYRGTWIDNLHLLSGTSGTEIDIKACVDLYWNSSTSGWQGCYESGWHDLRPGV